jgi:hypothetical protein
MPVSPQTDYTVIRRDGQPHPPGARLLVLDFGTDEQDAEACRNMCDDVASSEESSYKQFAQATDLRAALCAPEYAEPQHEDHPAGRKLWVMVRTDWVAYEGPRPIIRVRVAATREDALRLAGWERVPAEDVQCYPSNVHTLFERSPG